MIFGLDAHLIPHVSTHWNSSCDMIDVGVEYQEAVDGITQHRDLGLRKFKLSDHEWEVLKELRDVLKVSTYTSLPHVVPNGNKQKL